jgi:glycosyltransferase involved in cell wall biosynthesis
MLKGASLLHAHFGTDALKAWPVARSLNLPMLVTLHGYDININRDWWEAGHGGSGMRDYPTRLQELAKQPRVRFIAVSGATRQRAISGGIPADKISVRHIGVDCTKFVPSTRPITDRERRVLFVGRLVEKKGCEYLIRAFAKVQRAVADASLVIVGDGHLRGALQQLAGQLGVRVQFRGALSSVEVQKELGLAMAFCLPSVTAANGDAEGLPIVLLEAQASGVPTIISAHNGTTEAIKDGVTGFVFPERDMDAMANKLLLLLTDSVLTKTMAFAGPQFVTKMFDIRQCAHDLERSYDEVTKGI